MKKQWHNFVHRQVIDIPTLNYISHGFYREVFEVYGDLGEVCFHYFKDGAFTHYTTLDVDDWGNKVFDKRYNTTAKIKKFYHSSEKLLKDNLKYTEELSKRSDLTKEDYFKIFLDFKKLFFEIQCDFTVSPFLAIEAWQKRLQEMLENLIIKQKLEDQRDLIFEAIFTPWKKTALFEIKDKIKQGVDISILVKDYQFLRSWTAINYREITEDWIRKISTSSIHETKNNLSMEDSIRLLKPNPKEEKMICLAPYIIFFKDYRDDVRRKIMYLWSKYFERLAEFYQLEYFDLGYLMVDELAESLRIGKFDHGLIDERKKYPSIVTIESYTPQIKIKIITRDIDKYLKRITIKTTSVQEIKGQVAYSGIVTGRVKIIKSYHDVKRFVAGEVLVAVTTHPNYLPAMHQAVAFVTDEGGIISHAAIVSRELKKPCIVGTKIATKLLRDGDLVEVDANKGVVRKI